MNFNAHKNNRFVKYGHLHAEYAANVVSNEYFFFFFFIQQTINKTNQVFYISPYNTTWQAFRTS